MLKKFHSEKRSVSNYKLKEENDITNKLENLYQKSIKKLKNSSQLDAKEILLKDIPKFSKKINRLQKLSSFTRFQNRNKKTIFRYISIDSVIKKSPHGHSQSNEPPTLDATVKIISPRKNKNSINLNSTTKYKLKSGLKTVTEVKNSNNKKEYIIGNNEKVNYKINNSSINSNSSGNNYSKNFNEENKNQKKNDKNNEFNDYVKYLN